MPLWAVIVAAVLGATLGDQVGYLGAASLHTLESRLGLGSELLTTAVVLVLVVLVVKARRPRHCHAGGHDALGEVGRQDP
ncbi:MAG: hypothetical protein WA892_00965 [Ornithinimicrobium sp.]